MLKQVVLGKLSGSPNKKTYMGKGEDGGGGRRRWVARATRMFVKWSENQCNENSFLKTQRKLSVDGDNLLVIHIQVAETGLGPLGIALLWPKYMGFQTQTCKVN